MGIKIKSAVKRSIEEIETGRLDAAIGLPAVCCFCGGNYDASLLFNGCYTSPRSSRDFAEWGYCPAMKMRRANVCCRTDWRSEIVWEMGSMEPQSHYRGGRYLAMVAGHDPGFFLRTAWEKFRKTKSLEKKLYISDKTMSFGRFANNEEAILDASKMFDLIGRTKRLEEKIEMIDEARLKAIKVMEKKISDLREMEPGLVRRAIFEASWDVRDLVVGRKLSLTGVKYAMKGASHSIAMSGSESMLSMVGRLEPELALEISNMRLKAESSGWDLRKGPLPG